MGIECIVYILLKLIICIQNWEYTIQTVTSSVVPHFGTTHCHKRHSKLQWYAGETWKVVIQHRWERNVTVHPI